MTLANTAVSFMYEIKSNADSRNGGGALEDWATSVYTGDPDAEDAMPLEDGPEASDEDGMAMFSGTVSVDDLGDGPVTFTVMAPLDGQPDEGEIWDPSDALTVTHTGLELPPAADADPMDAGDISIKFTTQALYLGVHREVDDAAGYTDYRGGDGEISGDDRPSDDLIEAELMYSEDGGRLMRYEYKKFDDDGERTVKVANPMDVEDGMATFVNLPADMDFTVRIRAGSDRTAVTDRDVDAYDLTDADNRVVGAFGEGQSGARPDVWLCPQTDVSPADGAKEFKARCSAFGYQWTTGSVKVTVENLRDDVEATVALEPVTDNHSEGDSEDVEGNAKEEDQSHTFTDIQDGVYKVTLAGDGVGDPKAHTRKFYHDEASDDEDYEGVEADDVTFSATSLRAEIRGLVANNRIAATTRFRATRPARVSPLRSISGRRIRRVCMSLVTR